MTQQGNLLSCPMFKIEDRKTMVTRILDVLLADPDCRYNLGRGEWRQMTVDETANWEARQHFTHVSQDYTLSHPDLVIHAADLPLAVHAPLEPFGP